MAHSSQDQSANRCQKIEKSGQSLARRRQRASQVRVYRRANRITLALRVRSARANKKRWAKRPTPDGSIFNVGVCVCLFTSCNRMLPFHREESDKIEPFQTRRNNKKEMIKQKEGGGGGGVDASTGVKSSVR